MSLLRFVLMLSLPVLAASQFLIPRVALASSKNVFSALTGDRNPQERDRLAMLALAEAFTRKPSSWNAENPLRNWHGVKVDALGRVTEITLDSFWASEQPPAYVGFRGRLSPDISRLTALERLTIKNAELDPQLPRELALLPALTRLEIDSGTPCLLPENLGALASLTVLKLKGEGIASVPESVGRLSKLDELQVDGTRVSRLPESVGNLSSLTWLTLYDAEHLEALPESLGRLRNLRVLCVFGASGLKALPEGLGDLAELYSLQILQSGIEALPEGVARLKKLDNIDLSGARLAAVPEPLAALPVLRSLTLNDNRIRGPLPDFLFDLPLERLKMRGNPLEGVLSERLCNLSRLKYLDLSKTGISGPAPSCLTSRPPLLPLEELDLSGTRIAPEDPVFRLQAELRKKQDEYFLRYKEEPETDDSANSGPVLRLAKVSTPARLDEEGSGNWYVEDKRSRLWGGIQRFYLQLDFPGDELPALAELEDRINAALDGLEQHFPERVIQDTLAEAFYGGLEDYDPQDFNDPSSVRPKPTQEELARMLFITEVSCRVSEKDGKPSVRIDVWAKTYEEFFGGHALMLGIEDGVVVETNMMG